MAALPQTWWGRAHGALLWLGPGAVLAGRSSAYLQGWLERPPDRIEVAISRERAPTHPSIIVRRTRELPSRDITVKHSLSATSLPRTLIDLANSKDLEDLLDAALFRSERALRWIEQRLRGHHRGVPGIKRLRLLVAQRSAGEATADSVLEARAARLFKRARLKAMHQFPIVDSRGDFICEADFAWPAQRVLVQVDGRKYHSSRKSFVRRADQQQRLAAAGWRLLPVTWTDLTTRPEEVLRRIRATLICAKPEAHRSPR